MKIQPRGVDSIARIRAQWNRERPDLDTFPIETIGRILRIQFLVGARMRRLFQQHGIDSGGFDVLATLRRNGTPYRMNPTDLYQELVLTSGAMTNRIDGLERQRLVKRHPDPSDRRGRLIELTGEGKVLVDRVMTAHMEGEAELLAHLPHGDQRRLAHLLQKLLTGLEEEQ